MITLENSGKKTNHLVCLFSFIISSSLLLPVIVKLFTFNITTMNLFTIFTTMAVFCASNAHDWQIGSNGHVKWAFDCCFRGNVVGNQSSSGEDCGGLCVANQRCTHFTYNNGVCYLTNADYPTASDFKGACCGWVESRPAAEPLKSSTGSKNFCKSIYSSKLSCYSKSLPYH